MVDTGFNQSLLIHEWHLEKWAGILPTSARSSEPPRSIHGIKCPALNVDVWLHCLHNSMVRPVAFDHAIKLNVSSGALLSRIDYSKLYAEAKDAPARRGWFSWLRRRERPDDSGSQFLGRKPDDVPWNTYPHIPLIGMKTLQSNKLTLAVDGKRSCFSLQP